MDNPNQIAPNQILILFAHPALEKSRVNRRLIQAVQGLEAVLIHDLYEVYPDFQINVKAEQDLLLAHDIIIFHHPFYWYSSAYKAHRAARIFREHDEEALWEMANLKDDTVRFARSQQLRKDLERVLQADDEEIAHDGDRAWDISALRKET